MLEILYIVSMAIAFASELDNNILPYFLKYGIAFAWIVIIIFKDRCKVSAIVVRIAKLFLIPLCIAFVYTLVIWVIDRPEYVDFSYVSRLVSNIACMMIIAISAVFAASYFGKRIIQLSFNALILTTAINLVLVAQDFGIAPLIEYIKNVFSIDSYAYGSTISNIGCAMEVHDATFAIGFYIIYFIFYDDEDNIKPRILNIALGLIAVYLGFKRMEMAAILLVSFLALTIIRKSSRDFLKKCQMVGAAVLIISLGYIAFIKNMSSATWFMSILDTARINLYNFMAGQCSLSPFYFGKGFSYINKYLGDRPYGLLTASHSDMMRVYVEMGFWGFIGWIWCYFVHMTRKIYRNYSEIAGRFFLIASFFVFWTYLLDNTLALFANQYAYYIIPLGLAFGEMYEMRDNNFANRKICSSEDGV